VIVCLPVCDLGGALISSARVHVIEKIAVWTSKENWLAYSTSSQFPMRTQTQSLEHSRKSRPMDFLVALEQI